MGRKAHAKKLRRQDGEAVGHIRQQTRRVAAGLVRARGDALTNAAIRGRQSAEIAGLKLRVAQLLRANTRLRPWALRGRRSWWNRAWLGVRGYWRPRPPRVRILTWDLNRPFPWQNFTSTFGDEGFQ